MGSKKLNVSVKKLVRSECACYSETLNGIKDYCDREDTKDYRCVFFIKEEDNARCGYFEEAVLPVNPQLEALYIAEHKAKMVDYELTKEDKERIIEGKSSIAGKVQIHCKKCGKTFQADNYRQQYCKICKRYLRRESTRNAVTKNRDKCKQSAL